MPLTPYSHVNFDDMEDVAPANGLGDAWEARSGTEPLEAQETGMFLFRLPAGKRSPFTHCHEEAEETYVIISGTGRVKLGEEIRDVSPLDAIRVAASTPRAFEAGPDGLEFLAFGPRHENDGKPVDDAWTS